MVKTPCFQCRGGGGGLVNQSCPTLCDPMHCSPPGSSVHGFFQAKILEQAAISSSRGSSQLRDRTHVSCISCIDRQIFTTAPPGKWPGVWVGVQILNGFVVRQKNVFPFFFLFILCLSSIFKKQVLNMYPKNLSIVLSLKIKISLTIKHRGQKVNM